MERDWDIVVYGATGFTGKGSISHRITPFVPLLRKTKPTQINPQPGDHL